MFKCKIAGMVIEFHNRFDYSYKKCATYICDDSTVSDVVITLTDDEIAREQCDDNFPTDYLEFIAFHRKLNSKIDDFDAFVMHGAAISVFGDGYVFSAPSGTGKTTHISYWARLFGKDMKVVNGDKPIIRFVDGEPIIYGTPWCGKENLSNNICAPFKNLCFIHRSEQNMAKEISTDEAFLQLMNQILLPDDPIKTIRLMEMVDNLLKKCRCYNIFCNMSIDAARVAFDTMTKGDKE